MTAVRKATMNDDVSRGIGRRTLLTLSTAGLAALATACSTRLGGAATSEPVPAPAVAVGAGDSASPGGAAPLCVLVPETGEGPYYVPDAQIRSHIVEDRKGVPLRLDLTVVSTAHGCRPMSNVAVDVWQADALGRYSADGKTFLRGTQVTDAAGKLTFRTIVPGWYAHVAPHVHFKVRPDAHTQSSSQLFLPEELLLSVFAREPYSRREAPAHPNTRDDRFEAKGRSLTLRPVVDGAGYRASFVVGIA
ncbi:intradiol ring-cleavage dioxygenase [Streptomyces sp. NPDC006544]|uniref:dioxygenase family protein n=1 Tax=Streptomyces sp. NPDC006544 TaxID=3154583 RepID=UPI0033A8D1CC